MISTRMMTMVCDVVKAADHLMREKQVARPSIILLLFSCLTAMAGAATKDEQHADIAMSAIGAEVAKQYSGDGLSISATEEGVMLRCLFQRLQASVTSSGLWLSSTVEAQHEGRFSIKSVGLRRGDEGKPLPDSGGVVVSNTVVRWIRPACIEEFSTCVDGIRQDFLVPDRPEGTGALLVDLAVVGATAEEASGGVHILQGSSGRRLAYGKLSVSDAKGLELEARMSAKGSNRLEISVDDANATYPIRIDPTISDANWVGMGGQPGADNTVRALVVDKNAGIIYVGGFFSTIGGTAYNRIAKWTGSSWSALGDGVNNGVQTLALDANGVLYAGGYFTSAGGVPANRVARWNGSSWSALGSGVGGTVYALATAAGGQVYAGGYFTTAGGVSANYVAKWDGSNWTPLGSGTSDTVCALTTDGAGNLYAGGFFMLAGGASVSRVAKWDGVNWSALGGGVNGKVEVLLWASSGFLVAGGEFTLAGGVTANRVALFQNESWSALGTGMNGTVYGLALDPVGQILAAGGFSSAGGQSVNGIARWTGSSWAGLGAGIQSGGYAVATDAGGTVYAGGWFSKAGDEDALKIARWNGSQWSALASGAGVVGQVRALTVDPAGNLYIGGAFTSVGGTGHKNIAKWNGVSWSPLGSGTSSAVSALATDHEGNVYAGGGFTNAGGLAVGGVAKWNGSVWSPLGVGVNGYVYALLWNKGCLYVGGSFSSAGGLPACSLARWNGSTWSALDSDMNGYVQALALDGSGDLVVGGSFTVVNDEVVNNIAKWNGSRWLPLGTGLNQSVKALVSVGSVVYAGGVFTTAGDMPANHVARWNGDSWSELGAGLNGDVNALFLDRSGNLFAGGAFTNAGQSSVSRVAVWSRDAWSALGSGVNARVDALTMKPNGELYVGGFFSLAGGKVSSNIARLDVPSEPGILAVGTNGAVVASGEPPERRKGTDFWGVLLGQRHSYIYWITNASSSTLTLSGMTRAGVSNEYFSISGLPASLSAGARASLTIGYEPAVVGVHGVSFSISNNSPVSPFVLRLAGHGVLPTMLVQGSSGRTLVSDQSADPLLGTEFGNRPVLTSVTNVLSIVNPVSTPLLITGIGLGGTGASSFKVLDVPQRVENEGTAVFRLVFSPVADGAHVAELVISNNTAASPFLINLSGCGTGGVARVSVLGTNRVDIPSGAPADLARGGDFGMSTCGFAVTHTFIMTNSGTARLDVRSATLSGADADRFAVTNLPEAVNSGGVTNLGVIFRPLSNRSYSAVLEIVSNSGSEPLFRLNLAGTGVDEPYMSVLGTNGQVLASGEAPTVDKGNVYGACDVQESKANRFTITNSSPHVLYIRSFSVTGAAASSFTIQGLPQTMAGQSSASFSVLFAPRTDGLKTATLRIENTSAETPYIIPLAGEGTGGTPQISVTMPSDSVLLDDAPPTSGQTLFYRTRVGTWISKTFVITNAGTAELEVESVQVEGAADAFLVSGMPDVVPATEARPFTITYAPTATGSQTARIRISNDSQNTEFIINVSGSGYRLSRNSGPSAGGYNLMIECDGMGSGSDIFKVAFTRLVWGGGAGADGAIVGQGTNWVEIQVPHVPPGAYDIVVHSSSIGVTSFAYDVFTFNPPGHIGSASSWRTLGGGLGDTVYALALGTNGTLYAGGSFNMSGSVPLLGVAMWTGQTWTNVGGGVNGTVRALTMTPSGKLFAGGEFTSAGGLPANRIAKWNGSVWSQSGGGVNDTVYALAPYGSDGVMVGGKFTNAGASSNNYAAILWSETWFPLDDASVRNGPIYAMSSQNTENYCFGGDFDYGREYRHVAARVGWETPLYCGVNDTVEALAMTSDTRIFVGGKFDSFYSYQGSLGTYGRGLCLYYRGFWRDVVDGGLGGSATCFALACDEKRNRLYVGTPSSTGGFQMISMLDPQDPLWPYQGRFNKRQFLGGQYNLWGDVHAVVCDKDGNAYIGGRFQSVDGKQANGVAVWMAPSDKDGVYPDRASPQGGTVVSIHGTDLCSTNSGDLLGVSLCGVPVAGVVSSTPTQIVVVAAAGPIGAGDIVISSFDHGQTVRTNGFAYYVSELSLKNATNGVIASGALANTADGTHFGYVRVGQTVSNLFSVQAGLLDVTINSLTQEGSSCLSFAGFPGKVTAGGVSNFWVVYRPTTVGRHQLTARVANSSTNDPYVVNCTGDGYSLDVTAGPSAGGTVLTVTNAFLGNGADITGVWVCGVPATILGQGSNWVRVQTGAGAPGAGSLVVVSSSLGTVTFSNAFTYTPAGKISGGGCWRDMGRGLLDINPKMFSWETVFGLFYTNNTLYAGGAFHNAGNCAADHIARRIDGVWTNLGAGADSVVRVINVSASGALYAGGSFDYAGGLESRRIAVWQGAHWTNTLSGFYGYLGGAVRTIAKGPGGVLYAGGEFVAAGSCPAHNIAMWTGTVWTNMGSGINGPVHTIAVNSLGHVFAGGQFTSAGGVQANSIAKWNGASWSSLSTGMDGTSYTNVNALAIDAAGNLYAGGKFRNAGGVAAGCVAKWNGTAWSSLGTGMDADSSIVFSLAFDLAGNLIAGGLFETAGGCAARSIARWDGTQWSPLGAGLDNGVLALAAGAEGRIYAGGTCTMSGDLPVYSIAEWSPETLMSGVAPSSDLTSGGGFISISGENLGDGSDVTNVTLCGVSVREIVSQCATQLLVVAGAAPSPASGHVTIYSKHYGVTTRSNAFTYVSSMSRRLYVVGTNHAVIANGEASSSAKGSDFGIVPHQAVYTHRYAITNAGSEALTIYRGTVISDWPGVFTVSDMPSAIAPGEASAFFVTYSPPEGRDGHSASIVIENNSDQDPYVLRLRGSGRLSGPDLAVYGIGGVPVVDGGASSEANGSDFGLVRVPGEVLRTFTLRNDGGSALVITNITLSGTGASVFRVDRGVFEVAAGSAVGLAVRFVPAATADYACTLRLWNNTPASPFELKVRGQGLSEPLLSVRGTNGCELASGSSPSRDLGTDMDWEWVGSSHSCSYAMTNAGSRTLVFGASIINGPGAEAFELSGVPAELPSGAGTNVLVTFQPLRAGRLAAVFSIFNNTQTSPFLLSVAGTGRWDTSSFTLSGTNGASIYSGEAASLAKGTDFGSVSMGETPCNVLTLKNAGTNTLYVSDVAITGTGADFFELAGFPESLETGQVALVGLTFRGDVPGHYEADVTVSNSAPLNPFVLRVKGRRLSPAVLAVLGTNGEAVLSGDLPRSELGTAFLERPVTVAQTNTFTFVNSGEDVLSFSNAVWEGSGCQWFTIANLPSSVQGMAHSQVQIVFAPEEAGTYSAVLTLNVSATNSPLVLRFSGSSYSLSQAASPSAGGTILTISNGMLGNGSDITSVMVCGTPAQIVGQGSTWVQVLTGPGTPGNGDVVIHSSSMGDRTICGAFAYTPAGFIYDTQAGGWTAAEGLPARRYRTSAAVCDNALYSVAGCGTNGISSNVYRYRNAQWAEIAPLPRAVSNPGVAALNGDLYVFGGYDNLHVGQTNVYRYNGSAWLEVASIPKPFYEGSAVVYGDAIYLVAGRQDASTVNTNVYRFNGSTWSQAPSLPEGLYLSSCGVWNGVLYVASGQDQKNGAVKSSVYAFDGTSWTAVASLPVGRYGAAAAGLQDGFYVTGGHSGNQYTNITHRFDGTRWIECDPLPQSRGLFAGATELNGSLYVIGGYGDSGMTSNVYHYSLSSYGVKPASGSVFGGYPVTISGTNLCESTEPVTVTLCGIPVQSVLSQSPTQLVVIAGTGAIGIGDVMVRSGTYGDTIKAGAFTYMMPGLSVEGTNGMTISSGEEPTQNKGTVFGPVCPGQPITNMLAIRNTGLNVLSMGDVSLTGGASDAFRVFAVPSSVPVGGSAGFGVVFTPVSNGLYEAALELACEGSPVPYVVRLRGSAYRLSQVAGPSAGGTVLEINNGLLGNGADITNVTVCGVQAQILAQGSSWLQVRLGPGSVATGPIVIQSASQGTTVLPSAYTYNPPGSIGGIGPGTDWRWTQVESLPGARSGMAAGSVNGAIYVTGGDDGRYYTETFKYDGSSWVTLAAPLPDGRYSPASAVLNNKFYCIGGLDETYRNDVFCFDGTAWTQAASLPDARGRLAAGTLNGTIYAVGGYNGAVRKTVWGYSGSSWSVAPELPQPRCHLAVAVLGGALYAIGGFDENWTPRANVFRFNGSSWTETASLPVARGNLSAEAFNGAIYVFGGNATNVYKFDGGSWSDAIGLPLARSEMGSAVLNGALYAIGGGASSVYRYWGGLTNSLGVVPSSGPATGGVTVVISGINLCNGMLSDIRGVKLCGVAAEVVSVSCGTQIVVIAGNSGLGVSSGIVEVASVEYGVTVKSNAFTYAGPGLTVLGKNGASVLSDDPPVLDNGTDFGIIDAGMSVSNTFVIKNTGSQEVILADYAITGNSAGAFHVTGLPLSLPAGGQGVFNLSFTPPSRGSFTACLCLTNNTFVTPFRLHLAGAVPKLNQTITFAPLGRQIQTNVVVLSATASSGLPVDFSVESGPGVIGEDRRLSFIAPGMVSLTVSQAGNVEWGAAPEMTNTFRVYGLYSLEVCSSHGESEPVVGSHTNVEDVVITNRVAEPLAATGTRYTCDGWMMSGSEPRTGTGREFVMAVTNHAVLTWLWTTNYWLEVNADEHGSVNGADGWRTANAAAPLTAQADAHYHFTHWSGDMPGDVTNQETVQLIMDAPKAVTAHFAATVGIRNTPHWWLDAYGLGTNSLAEEHEDGDGVPAWQEYVADTDPTNPASYFHMAALSNLPPWTVYFDSSAVRQYTLEATTNLAVGPWVSQGNTNVQGVGGPFSLSVTNQPPSALYFRVRVRVPQE